MEDKASIRLLSSSQISVTERQLECFDRSRDGDGDGDDVMDASVSLSEVQVPI